MSHSHGHADPSTAGRFLFVSAALTLTFVIGEAVAGYFANSLALLSDAAHNFTDALALLLSCYAVHVAKRPSNARQTYGYHRVGILVALANAMTLVVMALIIFWEAFQRFRSPEAVQSNPMIVVALIAIAVNSAISFGLRSGAKHDLNLRSAYIHMLGDALACLGVVVAGLVVKYTGSPLADPIVSVLIGGMILWSSGGIVSEALNILLEAAPKNIDMASLEKSIRSIPGVLTLHDLHVWTVSSGLIACSCHVLADEGSVRKGQQVLRGVAEMLKKDYGINHSTIQIEIEGCEPNDMYCTLRVLERGHPGGQDGHRH